MIELIQQENNLIGSKEAIEALAEKDSARILTISDSHRSSEVFCNIVKEYGKNCDALIFCGDGIGDLAILLSKASNLDADNQNNNVFSAAIPPVIAFVQGNNDPSFYPVNENFRIYAPLKQVLTVCGRKLYIAHGHRQSIDFGYHVLAFEAQMEECSVIVHGHTHVAHDVPFGKNNEYRIINPGSCSRPRGGTAPGFAIITVTKNFVDTAFLEREYSAEGTGYKLFTPMEI